MKKVRLLLAMLCTVSLGREQVFAANPVDRTLHVTIYCTALENSDTLVLQLYSRFFPQLERAGVPELEATRDRDGQFTFALSGVSQVGYFSVLRRSYADGRVRLVPITPVHLFETGDSIGIAIHPLANPERNFYPSDNYSFTYSGTGSSKYALEDRLDSLMSHTKEVPPDLIDSAGQVHDQWSKLRQRTLDTLAACKATLSPLVAAIFSADIRYANSKAFFMSVRGHLQRNPTPQDSMINRRARLWLLSESWDWERGGDQGDSALYWSKSFAFYVRDKWNFLSWFKKGFPDPEWIFNSICEKYVSPIRDRLLLSFFLNNEALPEDMAAAYRKAQRLVEDPFSKDALSVMQSKLAAAPAYNFNLSDREGKMWRLSDFKGKPVLIDVWFTGCGGCAATYQSVLKELEASEAFKGRITFISISLDQDRTQWLSGIASGLYTGDHAVNLYTDGKALAHPFVEHYRINTFPTLILIDGKQKMVKFNSVDLFSKTALRETLKELL